ncbi:MAG: hypothetical protein QOD38_1368, partial [Acidimicrobiaceae bacterium]|jgi:hypothetical protein
LDSEHKEQVGPGAINLDDPVLQRAMNKLQILDAICGQLDRHAGNWYIDADEKTGKVKGVTGIDLDMAFGSEMEDTGEKDSGYAQNFIGMPDMVDEEFAQRIMLVKPDDIRNTLKGLLSEKEIESTVKRFTSVRSKIEEVAKKRGLVKQWDDKTATENRLKQSAISAGHKSYGSQMAGGAQGILADKAKKAVTDALTSGAGPAPFRPDLMRQFDELPPVMTKAIKDQLRDLIATTDDFTDAIWSGAIPATEATGAGLDLVNNVLSNQGLMSKLIVAIQEAPEGFPSAYRVAGQILKPVVKQLIVQATTKTRRSTAKV